jgi:glyoxylase-like metal-dependent hydrolase (beta-lactamase superfamily II)
LLSVSAGAAENEDIYDVELESIRLSDTVYMLEPEPPTVGNLAISAGEDGILMVDDQLMSLTDKIRAAVAEIQPGEITFLVNSHYHFDHAGGNAEFGKESTIVAHHNVRSRLAEGREAGPRFIEGTRPPEALPVITFRESVTFHWNGEDVDVIHLPNPSHTDGDAVVFFRGSNVIHMGDQYINLGGLPYVDRDVGGNALGLRDNMALLLGMIDEETKIIPGHGPLASKPDLQWFHDLLAGTIAFIEAEKNAGRTLEQVQSAGLPDQYKEGTSGFIPHATWIQYVYSSLED